jgi:hypothetical protein
MFHIVLALLAGFAQAPSPAQTQDATRPTCNLTSKVNGPDDPLLGHLKGTAAFFCSGAFVTLEGRSKSEHGLLLTSGHCVMKGRATIFDGRLTVPAPGEVLRHVKDHRTFTLETGNAAAPRACVSADELLYATLSGVDLAIYRLTETYEEVERRTGTGPLRVASGAQVPAGARVRLPSAFHQRNYACGTDGTVPGLREEQWTSGPVLRLTKGCNAPPGGSGSPILREDTNEVVAVFSTAYEADGVPCALMNPCEIDEKGATSVADKGRPYAHFVHRLHECFDARGKLDLTAAGCPLPRPPE